MPWLSEERRVFLRIGTARKARRPKSKDFPTRDTSDSPPKKTPRVGSSHSHRKKTPIFRNPCRPRRKNPTMLQRHPARKRKKSPWSCTPTGDANAIREPGGYGVVMRYGDRVRELSGGFRLTTNNRMELLACIEGLKCLKFPCRVTLHSDSKYVVNGISKGWARKWRANGWMRNKEERAVNPDLWSVLLDLCEIHDVRFVWVKGHAGIADNERCDALAGRAMSRPGLPADTVYETRE